MIFKAEKTLELVENAIFNDDGVKFKLELKQAVSEMLTENYSDAFKHDEKPRDYIGASGIGGNCNRKIWYAFHWAKKIKNDARMIRLFNRGHLEEARFIAALRAAGITVYFQNSAGYQYGFRKGHFAGHCDGIAEGFPENPDKPAVVEFKTHNENSFNQLQRLGLFQSKPEHYAQMQVYMKALKLDWGMYCAINKNTDAYYFEAVSFNEEIADKYFERAENIANSELPPPRITNSPGRYPCNYCDYKTICFLIEKPEKNCRTCKHYKIGKTTCNKERVCVTIYGCGDYELAEKFNTP